MSEDSICECGHRFISHGDNGCIHCKCSNSITVMKLVAERDELREQLDKEIPYIDKFHKERDIANYKLEIAVKAMKVVKKEVFDGIEGDFFLAWNTVDEALAEIEKLEAE